MDNIVCGFCGKRSMTIIIHDGDKIYHCWNCSAMVQKVTETWWPRPDTHNYDIPESWEHPDWLDDA